jgi:hypothetical protein
VSCEPAVKQISGNLGAASFLKFGPIFEPMDKAKSRPRIVHGTDLIIDQSRIQTDFSDPIFGQIRGHAGSLLGPCDPQTSGRGEALDQAPEFFG